MGVEVRKQPQVVRGSQGERVPFQFVAPPDTGTRKQWNNNEYPPLLWVFQGQIGRQKGGRAAQHPCGIGAKCLCSIWKYQRVIFWGSNTEVLSTYQVRPTIAWLLRGFVPLNSTRCKRGCYVVIFKAKTWIPQRTRNYGKNLDIRHVNASIV